MTGGVPLVAALVLLNISHGLHQKIYMMTWSLLSRRAIEVVQISFFSEHCKDLGVHFGSKFEFMLNLTKSWGPLLQGPCNKVQLYSYCFYCVLTLYMIVEFLHLLLLFSSFSLQFRAKYCSFDSPHLFNSLSYSKLCRLHAASESQTFLN